jgi:hypothetical protein
VRDADYGRILVTYEDRLTRFGFSYLEWYFDCYGVTITVIKDETDKSAQEELVAALTGSEMFSHRCPTITQTTRDEVCLYNEWHSSNGENRGVSATFFVRFISASESFRHTVEDKPP